MRRILGCGLVAASLVVAGNASAAYHIMMVTEVMAGPGSYVVLQMYADGQNVTGGHTVNVYDVADNLLDSVTLTNVANGANQSRILIGTAQTQATFGVAPDFATLKTLPTAGGKVCFDPAAAPIDCFSWGAYPNKVPTGAPFAALDQTSAAKRKTAGGASAALDAADDTNDSAADFVAGLPSPINNKGEMGGPMDAGSSTSSSSSASSSSSSSSSGGAAASSSSSTSGVGTNPSSSSSSSSTSGAPAPAAAATEDEGCSSTAGDVGTLTAAPFLALVGLAALRRRRR